MAKPKDKDVLRLVAVFGATFAIIVGLAVAGILFRSPDVVVEQQVYPLGLTINPNPFPGIGLNTNGAVNFTFELTVINSNRNPNLTLTVYVLPSQVQNLSVSHCLENSQPNLTGLNGDCDQGEWSGGAGTYFANVTSGSSVVLRIQALLQGTINEPVSLNWRFYAEGEEIP